MKISEKEHLNKLSDMGCIVCRNVGYGDSPAEIHHLRKGCGAGQRASNYRAIPLCPQHHRLGGYGVAIHAGQKEWEKNFGTEEQLLEQALKEIEEGIIW